MDDLIKKNHISVIYIIGPLEKKNNFNYVSLYQNCAKEVLVFEHLNSYELKNCSFIDE